MQGDISQPADRPPGNAPEQASMPTYFHQQALKIRDRLGTQLLPSFRSRFRALFNMLSGLSPQQWAMPCAFFRRTQPAHAFLLLSIQELVIHGWDIRSRFNANATPRAESLPPLMERIPQRSGFRAFPIDTDRRSRVRYRFDLEVDRAPGYDLIVEGGKACMVPSGKEPVDVILRCDWVTFALMMYKRLTLDHAVEQGRVSLDGDDALAALLDRWLKQP
jgi:hypothetical protein